MESLQLAQMLADISDLSATVCLRTLLGKPVGSPNLRFLFRPLTSANIQEPKAANALVNANKTLPTNPPKPQDVQNLRSSQTAPGVVPRSSSSTSQHPFDKFGRKILTPPPMSRTNSTGPASKDISYPGTPRELANDDVNQASHLMTLYEIRNRLKQQDSTGLKKAREQIDALIERTKQRQEGSQSEAQTQTERPRPMSRTYTYPKTGLTADPVEKK